MQIQEAYINSPKTALQKGNTTSSNQEHRSHQQPERDPSHGKPEATHFSNGFRVPEGGCPQ